MQPLVEALERWSTSTTTTPTHAGYLDPAAPTPCSSRRWPGSTPPTSRALARLLRGGEKQRAAEAGVAPRSSPELLREVIIAPDLLGDAEGALPARVRAAGSSARVGPRRASTRARPPRRCSGSSGPAPPGPPGCASSVEGGGPAARLAHRDLDAVCALFETPPGPRSSAATPRSPPSSTPWPRSRSPPTPWPSRGSAATQSDCSPRTAPRDWSGGWWWWPTSRRRAGPTCVGGRSLLQADRIGESTACYRRSRRARCWPRSDGSSTSPAREPASGWSSRRSPPRTTTASNRPGSSPSWACTTDTSRVDPARPLSLAGLVAELRRTLADGAQPAPLRTAAAQRLARLATEDDRRSSAGPAGRPRQLVGHPRAHRVGRPRCVRPTSRSPCRPAR